jgi:hypothetical protein
MLERTDLTVTDHQRLTIERYDRIRAAVSSRIHILPVLQGYQSAEYVAHVNAYGDRLTPNLWGGVGSVCKRNEQPDAIEAVLRALKGERPDLRLPGVGVKLTAPGNAYGREHLGSSDRMAWSFGARKARRDPNSWEEAMAYCNKVAERLAA